MKYSLYKSAASVIKSGLKKRGEVVESGVTGQPYVDPTKVAKNYQRIQSIVDKGYPTTVTTYNVPPDPGLGSYVGNGVKGTLDATIFMDAADRLRDAKDLSKWTVLPKADIDSLPGAHPLFTPLRTGFGALEGLSALNNTAQTLDPNRDAWDRGAAGLQAALNASNAFAFGGEAIAPWVANRGLGNVFLRGVSGASRLTPITFAGGIALEAGRREADRLNQGTKRSERWDAATRNLPSKWISWMQQSPDEAYGLKAIAEQNPKLFQQIVRAAQEGTKTWGASVKQYRESAKPNKPLKWWQYNPYSMYARHLREREKAYGDRLNRISGSLDPQNNAWMNENVTYLDPMGNEFQTTAGAIYNQAIQDILRREDPTFVTTDSGVVRSHRAGGMQLNEPQEAQQSEAQQSELPERVYVQPFPIPF